MQPVMITISATLALIFTGTPLLAQGGESTNWRLRPAFQLRLGPESARNQNLTGFSFAPAFSERQLLERVRFGVRVESPVGLSGLAQGQWYGRWGGVDSRSDFDLYFGYLDYRRGPVLLRAGRQDFSYGSTFFLGPNDFYNGLAWDGLRVGLGPLRGLSLDLIGVRLTALNPGDPALVLAGLYGSYRRRQSEYQAYLFYQHGGFPFYHPEPHETDDQTYYTLGLRWAGAVGGFVFEVEPVAQMGRVAAPHAEGRDRVLAYGGHIDLSYTLPVRAEPRLFAAYALGSGDVRPEDGRFSQFHGNVFNDNSLVGDMSVIADLSGVAVDGVFASGIRARVVGLSFNPRPALSLSADYHRFSADATPPGLSHSLGSELNVVLTWKAAEDFSILASYNRFFDGDFFRQASGESRDIDYVYLRSSLEF